MRHGCVAYARDTRLSMARKQYGGTELSLAPLAMAFGNEAPRHVSALAVFAGMYSRLARFGRGT